MREIEKWESQEGVDFLGNIGVTSGQTVLDFGAGVGHYAIPLARAVGEHGKVYAIDRDRNALKELEQRARVLELHNISVVRAGGGTHLEVENEVVDMVLFYDVLHYFTTRGRVQLYREAYRVLKPRAALSVYPKHTVADDGLWALRAVSIEDVKHEIQRSGFTFEQRYCGRISHDNGLVHGCVLNFRKRDKETLG